MDQPAPQCSLTFYDQIEDIIRIICNTNLQRFYVGETESFRVVVLKRENKIIFKAISIDLTYTTIIYTFRLWIDDKLIQTQRSESNLGTALIEFEADILNRVCGKSKLEVKLAFYDTFYKFYLNTLFSIDLYRFLKAIKPT